jgi:23S rRNA-/tRNA-specific pseudouridylate synthase
MVIADAPPADAHPPTQPPPPRRAVVRRSRGRVVRRLDRNRPLEILAVLLLYVVVVNYTLKFASFLVPDDAPPSREESLSLRGSSSTTAVWGLSSMRSSMPASSSPSPSRARGGGRSSLPRHRDYSGMNSRFGICMRSPSSSASSRRGDAVEVARGGSEAEDGIVVSVVDGAADDDDGAGDDRVSAQPTNAPPPSTTTKRKKDDRSRYDRIPVLSYQNDYVIVSKPCGMTMHRNSKTRWGRPRGPVLEAAVRRQLGRKPYLVHRLDHRTSGACLLGFAPEKAAELHGRLRGEGAIKLYVALVRGDLRDRFRRAAAPAGSVGGDDEVGEGANADDGDRGAIGGRGRIPDVMVGEGRQQPSERSLNDDDEYCGKITVNLPIKVNIDGIEIEKDASTDFYFLSSMTAEDDDVDGPSAKDETGSSTAARYVNKSLTLLLCHPRTGRTHQIRRHLQKALAAPIIGDVEHGDSRVNRYWRESIGLDRLGLHCWYLGLPPLQAASSPPSSSEGDDDVIECLAPLTLDFALALRHEKLGPLWSEARSMEPRLGMEPYDERGGTFGRNFRRRR